MTTSKKKSHRETHTHTSLHGDFKNGIPKEKTHTPKLTVISEMESLSRRTKTQNLHSYD
jgi:hypothetical protein